MWKNNWAEIWSFSYPHFALSYPQYYPQPWAMVQQGVTYLFFSAYGWWYRRIMHDLSTLCGKLKWGKKIFWKRVKIGGKFLWKTDKFVWIYVYNSVLVSPDFLSTFSPRFPHVVHWFCTWFSTVFFNRVFKEFKVIRVIRETFCIVPLAGGRAPHSEGVDNGCSL